MKIYHSFWEGGYKNVDEDLYNMHKLSALTALKNHGNITLITTERGKEFLKDIPYTNIELFEEEIPYEYSRVWAISKLFAYKQIVNKNQPFLHIDYDVFLFKKLPDNIMNADVICQNIEDEYCVNGTYCLPSFLENCKNKYLLDGSLKYAYNVGIFGGNNISAIKYYVDEVMKLLFDQYNKDFWVNENHNNNHWFYSVIVEQLYLSYCMKKININPTVLFESYPYEPKSKELGYTHLMGMKNCRETMEKVKNKLKQIEYEFSITC